MRAKVSKALRKIAIRDGNKERGMMRTAGGRVFWHSDSWRGLYLALKKLPANERAQIIREA